MRIAKHRHTFTHFFIACAYVIYSICPLHAYTHSYLTPPGSKNIHYISFRKHPLRETPVKILLVNMVNGNSSTLDFPIGVYTLKSYLELNYNDRCIVEIKDIQLDTMEDIVDFAVSWKPDILGPSIMLDAFDMFEKFMKSFTAQSSDDKTPLLAVGKNIPTFAPVELLAKFPEAICVLGEGELAIGGLVEYLTGTTELSQVPNIVYREGKQVVNNARSLLPDLALIGKVDYSSARPYVVKGGHVWIERARGCPWGHCSFCSTKAYWSKNIWRTKPVETLIEELKYISEELGVERVTFTDEEFIGNGMEGIKNTKQLALAIIQSGVKIDFYMNARADVFYNDDDHAEERDERIETLRLLKSAGLKIIYLGIESGSSSQLKRFAKGMSINEAERAIRICRELGVEMAIGWLMLEPMVTKEEIKESLAFIDRNRILPYLSNPLNQMRIYPSIPYHRLIKSEERRSGKRLVSDALDINSLTFETIDFKDPQVKIIADILEEYRLASYALHNSIKWHLRFDPHADLAEFVYLRKVLESIKESQINLADNLTGLTDDEVLSSEKPQELLTEALAEQNTSSGQLRNLIIEKGHQTTCSSIMKQIDLYFSNLHRQDISKALDDRRKTWNASIRPEQIRRNAAEKAYFSFGLSLIGGTPLWDKTDADRARFIELLGKIREQIRSITGDAVMFDADPETFADNMHATTQIMINAINFTTIDEERVALDGFLQQAEDTVTLENLGKMFDVIKEAESYTFKIFEIRVDETLGEIAFRAKLHDKDADNYNRMKAELKKIFGRSKYEYEPGIAWLSFGARLTKRIDFEKLREIELIDTSDLPEISVKELNLLLFAHRKLKSILYKRGFKPGRHTDAKNVFDELKLLRENLRKGHLPIDELTLSNTSVSGLPASEPMRSILEQPRITRTAH